MKLVRIIRELPLDDEVCWCRVSALTPGIEGGRAGHACQSLHSAVPRSELRAFDVQIFSSGMP